MKEIILNGQSTNVRLERYSDQLPSEADISSFEQSLGYKLPDDYREFLLNYNGGVCELKNIIVPIDGYLCDLFGLHADDADSRLMKLQLPTSPELTELWGELPTNILPIGEVDSGDMIALRFDGNDAEVVVLDHEDEEMRAEMRENSFTDFLANTVREGE